MIIVWQKPPVWTWAPGRFARLCPACGRRNRRSRTGLLGLEGVWMQEAVDNPAEQGWYHPLQSPKKMVWAFSTLWTLDEHSYLFIYSVRLVNFTCSQNRWSEKGFFQRYFWEIRIQDKDIQYEIQINADEYIHMIWTFLCHCMIPNRCWVLVI